MDGSDRRDDDVDSVLQRRGADRLEPRRIDHYVPR